MSFQVIVWGPALSRRCAPATLQPLIERHRTVGARYSQFRVLYAEDDQDLGTVLHIVVGTHVGATLCALHSEWELVTGEAPPAWPGPS